jgi:hypothetical protein
VTDHLPNLYAVRYEEIGGWADDLGDVTASTVADALALVEETIITTEHRTNEAGDCWRWNGTDYLASSEAHEGDGFGYIDWHAFDLVEDLGEAVYTWTVRRLPAIGEDRARRIAADWHGGQWTPLYAFASSGTVGAGLIEAVARELAEAPTPADRRELGQLRRFLLAEHGARLAREHARTMGAEHGHASATWVEEPAEALELLEAGDLEHPAPLSGEWADSYTAGDLEREVLELLTLETLEEWEAVAELGELCDVYEAAHFDAWTAELHRRARALED